MRDPAEIYTRRGMPIIALVVRLCFGVYFAFTLWSVFAGFFARSQLTYAWIAYQLILYLFMEFLYSKFYRKGIDLTFGWPLVLAVVILNLSTLVLGGQEEFPLMNRAEHFASFVLLGYLVWIFFLKYLPQNVWHNHPYYTALLTLSVTSLLGVGNEIVELILDQIFATSIIGAGFDTSLDLLMNSLGTGLFLAVRLIIGTLEEK